MFNSKNIMLKNVVYNMTYLYIFQAKLQTDPNY